MAIKKTSLMHKMGATQVQLPSGQEVVVSAGQTYKLLFAQNFGVAPDTLAILCANVVTYCSLAVGAVFDLRGIEIENPDTLMCNNGGIYVTYIRYVK